MQASWVAPVVLVCKLFLSQIEQGFCLRMREDTTGLLSLETSRQIGADPFYHACSKKTEKKNSHQGFGEESSSRSWWKMPLVRNKIGTVNFVPNRSPKIAHPVGFIGANFPKKAYLEYLIDKYFEERRKGRKFGDTKTIARQIYAKFRLARLPRN